MSAEKRTASFWLPVRTIAQIAHLAAALHTTRGEVITRAIADLAQREGLPVEEQEPAAHRLPQPRPPRTRRIADPPGPIQTKYNN